MRAYQVGFTHGAEAVLEVLAAAGLIDDMNYLLDLDVHDDDRVARLLFSSWEEITREACAPRSSAASQGDDGRLYRGLEADLQLRDPSQLNLAGKPSTS
jgi:hypothetical protein